MRDNAYGALLFTWPLRGLVIHTVIHERVGNEREFRVVIFLFETQSLSINITINHQINLVICVYKLDVT